MQAVQHVCACVHARAHENHTDTQTHTRTLSPPRTVVCNQCYTQMRRYFDLGQS